MDHAASRDSVAHSGGYTKKMPWLAGAPATSRCQPGQRRSSNAGRPPAPAAAHPSDRGRRSAPSPGVGPEVADLSKVTRRSEEHTSELQSRFDIVCRLLLEKK